MAAGNPALPWCEEHIFLSPVSRPAYFVHEQQLAVLNKQKRYKTGAPALNSIKSQNSKSPFPLVLWTWAKSSMHEKPAQSFEHNKKVPTIFHELRKMQLRQEHVSRFVMLGSVFFRNCFSSNSLKMIALIVRGDTPKHLVLWKMVGTFNCPHMQ